MPTPNRQDDFPGYGEYFPFKVNVMLFNAALEYQIIDLSIMDPPSFTDKQA